MAKGYGRLGGGNLGGVGNLRGQFQNLQKQITAKQEEIAGMEVSVSVGGGAMKITMTGNQVCKSVEIDPEFLKDADAEMLQDMFVTGVNSAIEKSKQMSEEQMNAVTGGLMGGLSGLGLGF